MSSLSEEDEVTRAKRECFKVKIMLKVNYMLDIRVNIMINTSCSTDSYHMDNMCWYCFITLTHLCYVSSFPH